MWSEILDVGTFGSRFDDMPDGFRCEAFAPDLSLFAYSPKDCTLIYLSCSGPLIDGALRPAAPAPPPRQTTTRDPPDLVPPGGRPPPRQETPATVHGPPGCRPDP